MQKIVVARDICKGCRLCISACPQGILAVSKTINKNGYFPMYCTDDAKCASCALCAVNCPDVAIEVYKEQREDAKVH